MDKIKHISLNEFKELSPKEKVGELNMMAADLNKCLNDLIDEFKENELVLNVGAKVLLLADLSGVDLGLSIDVDNL